MSINQIADQLAPDLRDAFLRAVSAMRKRTQMRPLIAAIESGNVASIQAVIQANNFPADLTKAVKVVDQIFAKAGAFTAQQVSTDVETSYRFDVINPRAAESARVNGARFVTEITAETQAAIRALVERSFAEAIAPRELGRMIRPLIGLTERQAMAVINARMGWIEAGLRADKVAAKAEAYAAKLLRQRALLIARTESIQAANEGQRAAWDQAASKGLIQPHRTQRRWLAARGERTCKICGALHNQTVAFTAAFVTITGRSLMGPTAHPACRCSTRLVFDGGTTA